jgi:hypothetical protein
VANSNLKQEVPGMVSVIIPCYNQGRYLRETLDSVLSQTYKRLEVLVIDDGSTDNTAEIAKAHGDAVRYFWLNDLGPSAARNLGLSNARGQYIQFLDGDDLLLPEKVERQIASFDNSPELQVSYCDFMHGQADNPKLPAATQKLDWRIDLQRPLLDLTKRWETQLSLPPHCFLYDARIFREHGVRFDDILLPKGKEDWEILLQVFALPVKLRRLEQCLAVYRGAVTSATAKEQSSVLRLEKTRQQVAALLDKHLRLHCHNEEMLAALQQKRREMDARYARKIELTRWSLKRSLKSFLRRQGARLPVNAKTRIKAALFMK